MKHRIRSSLIRSSRDRSAALHPCLSNDQQVAETLAASAWFVGEEEAKQQNALLLRGLKMLHCRTATDDPDFALVGKMIAGMEGSF